MNQPEDPRAETGFQWVEILAGHAYALLNEIRNHHRKEHWRLCVLKTEKALRLYKQTADASSQAVDFLTEKH